ncbi:CapA family protein [Streptomyces sp. NPDC051907]|uniref:CapA family protein n=1 Tax=Streptomyces sp. NPDC051907 TaxID=3155284 RepID=UPI00343C8CBC
MRGDMVTLFLCGDVMLGRGVDQILPCPGDPLLWESYISDARSYVGLAEAANGAIPWPVGYAWPWGDALEVLEEVAPDVRVVNLETSVTRSGDVAEDKEVCYRMNPGNLPCLVAARPDVCVLANNHVLDFGRRGLEETLDSLAGAGLCAVGAGRDGEEARRPAEVDVGGGRRVLVFSFGAPSSGIPHRWAAGRGQAGVWLVPELSDAAAADVVRRVRRARRPGDVVVVSVHWGSNWGYGVSRGQVRFARALVDGGVDVVHGHSSHHPRPLEIYRGRPIVYGCGDFIDDYEGISGHEEYRDDLRLLYFVSVRPDADRDADGDSGAGVGEPAAVRIVPMQARRMRLWHASDKDRAWLRETLERVSPGLRVSLEPGGLAVRSAVGG